MKTHITETEVTDFLKQQANAAAAILNETYRSARIEVTLSGDDCVEVRAGIYTSDLASHSGKTFAEALALAKDSQREVLMKRLRETEAEALRLRSLLGLEMEAA